jgi:hypothetical protein
MDSSRLSIKLFAAEPPEVKLEDFVPIFHSWIQTRAIPDHLLIDVASYAHVHNGPGIVLVAHEANYSLDRRGGHLGVTYQRKQPILGTFAERVRITHQAALHAASLLGGKLRFRRDELAFRICDRLNAPTTPATFESVKGDLLKVWPGAELRHQPGDLELFTVMVNPA